MRESIERLATNGKKEIIFLQRRIIKHPNISGSGVEWSGASTAEMAIARGDRHLAITFCRRVDSDSTYCIRYVVTTVVKLVPIHLQSTDIAPRPLANESGSLAPHEEVLIS